MLCNLDIKNIAVIDNLSFEPGEGMSVLTGETGAGKSVVIDSINLILGARTNKNLLRHGEQKATVSAMLTYNDRILETLENNGITVEDGTFVISREITQDGKSVARINGVMVPLSLLRDISDMLIDIHGQHDNQALLNPSRHIDFLDYYADNNELKSEYTKLYQKLLELKKEYEKLSQNERDRFARIDLLKYQLEELEGANLKIGEKEDLFEEIQIISNSEKISSSVGGAYSVLFESDQCVYDNLQTVLSQLSSVTEFDPLLSDLYDRLNEASYVIDDAAHELRNYADRIEFDEQRLDEASERLDLIKRLERKYGLSVEGCIEYMNNASIELEALSNSDKRRDEIDDEIQSITKEITLLGNKLSKKRIEFAKKLSAEIELQLHDLDMDKTVFIVSVVENGEIGANGFDSVEFMFSANPGHPPRPLVQIASGGELSRVMLAIKSVLADTDEVDTLIFDEIDTGVSGKAAQKIAKKLSNLAKSKQVICISHQPQLAAICDNQFKIEKMVENNITSTKITRLDFSERVEELARMIDGNNITKTAIDHAREMLEGVF